MTLSNEDILHAARRLLKKVEGTDFEHLVFVGGDSLAPGDQIAAALILANIQKGEYARAGQRGMSGIAFRSLVDATNFRLCFRGAGSIRFITRWDFRLWEHEEAIRQYGETARFQRAWYTRAINDLQEAEARLAAAEAELEKFLTTKAAA